MKVLYSAIKKLVPGLKASPKQVGEALTLTGFMMESLTEVSYKGTKDYLIGLIQDLNAKSHLKIQGLMTIAPFISSDKTRPYFRRMRSIFDALADKCESLDNVEMKILSMGMSNDYITALEEGSTMIRIGSAVFNDSHSNPKT